MFPLSGKHGISLDFKTLSCFGEISEDVGCQWSRDTWHLCERKGGAMLVHCHLSHIKKLSGWEFFVYRIMSKIMSVTYRVIKLSELY